MSVPLLKAALAALACTATAGAVAAQAPDEAPAPRLVAGSADYSTCSRPVYPQSALRKKEEGSVVLTFLAAPNGSVMDSKVAKSSGSRDLDQAALAAISLCRFRPKTVNGQPVEAWVTVQYVWMLPR